VFEQKLRVLVLDDDLSFLELVRDVLTTEGLEVSVSAKPLAADKVAEYDVAIIDVLFARAPTGLALARELLERPDRPKLIICSADGGLLRERAAELERPGVRVLGKPFEIEALLAAVRDLVSA